MTAAGLTDAQYDLADRIEATLEAADRDGLTPSGIARKLGLRTTPDVVRRVLRYMVDHQYAHTSGNGAWTHYHAGRR